LNDEDFLAILATGGGKSLCFQLPALMKAEGSSYLTIVISPLQSLMKDQTDNLMKKKHLTNVGFLNGSLNPLERKEVAKKVEFGGIDLLYLSPEMLRSFSIQNILSKRLIDRIVIDEAHCFSKRGHDFRIDYMFIADFIKELGKKNKSLDTVSISCFTATAKQEVADEIKTYFKEHFNKELKEFRSTAKRGNLSYKAYELGDKNSSPEKIEHLKFQKLVEILEHTVQGQPCIIFTRFRGKSEKV
jgi:ATP-dependent DNA helicase RecQ